MRKIICLCCVFMFVTQLKADYDAFDVIEFSLDGEIYYHSFSRFGLVKENDVQGYYDYQGNLIMPDIVELVKNRIRGGYPDSFFKTMLTINKDKLSLPNRVLETHENKNYIILKNVVQLEIFNLNDSFKVIGLHKGNIYGYTFSDELNYNDIHWINNYELEYIFSFGNSDGVCNQHLFGIKGNTTKEEVEIIKERLLGKNLLKDKNILDETINFSKVLSDLHKRNIIMVGFCSC